jgi:lipopolysaccharide/colanic/teichoic acid biosynthesis glycosyltransferase
VSFLSLIVFCSVSLWSLIIVNTENINDQKKTNTENQWSKGNRIQRLSMIKRKQNKKIINNQKKTKRSLIVFLFCFLLIIDSPFVLFLFDHWLSFCSVSFWSIIVFLFCVLFIIGKQNKNTINDQKETGHKDYQWSKGNKTQTINDQKETEHKDYQWSKGNRTKIISIWSSIVFLFSFHLTIDSLFVLFPFDHW